MKNIFFVIMGLILFSCDFMLPKDEHRFVYSFDNSKAVSDLVKKETISTLSKRLDKLGLDFQIQVLDIKQFEIIVKASKLNIDHFNNLITNKGKLEFWELYNGAEFQIFFTHLDSEVEDFNIEDFTATITKVGYQGGPVIFCFKSADTSYVNAVLNKRNLTSELPVPKSKVKFLWGIPDENGEIPLYAAKSNRENKPKLTGEVITEAFQVYGVTGRPEVAISMNDKGALVWERLTEKAFQNRSQIAIVLNDLVYSAPGVTSGPIVGGKSSISGDFTVNQAQDLAIILGSGRAIPSIELVEYELVKSR